MGTTKTEIASWLSRMTLGPDDDETVVSLCRLDQDDNVCVMISFCTRRLWRDVDEMAEAIDIRASRRARLTGREVHYELHARREGRELPPTLTFARGFDVLRRDSARATAR
jgi:hypothetical protein